MRGGRARRPGVEGRCSTHSLMTEKLARRGLHVPREFMPDVLSATRVADVMAKVEQLSAAGRPSVAPEAWLLDALVRMVEEHVDELAVADGDGRHLGIITQSDIMQAACGASRARTRRGRLVFPAQAPRARIIAGGISSRPWARSRAR